MALLSFRGISTPSLPAQGEQRRSFYFNIRRDIPVCGATPACLEIMANCEPAGLSPNDVRLRSWQWTSVFLRLL
jgi:hypothetical protein